MLRVIMSIRVNNVSRATDLVLCKSMDSKTAIASACASIQLLVVKTVIASTHMACYLSLPEMQSSWSMSSKRSMSQSLLSSSSV